jgi:site-specific recombinase XerD
MSELRSIFAAELDEYLSVRRITLAPRTCEIDRQVLGSFDSWIAELGMEEKTVTEEMINGWIRFLSERNHSRTVNNKVSCRRCFLKYLRYCGIPVFMPQCPKYYQDYMPYIFSDAEMKRVFRRSDKAAHGACGRAGFEFAMLLRVLYGCGLRLGEALKLIRSDVDFKRGTLLLRQPKNKKQRIAPMHESLTKMLMQYCVATEIFEQPEAFLFPGTKPDTQLPMHKTRGMFRAVLKSAKVFRPAEKAGQRGQCLHCLRHLFAVKSFAQAEGSGISTADSVPYLSVYLGHFDMDGTEKYLKFSSDIFPEHTGMFEAYSTGVFSILGGVE